LNEMSHPPEHDGDSWAGSDTRSNPWAQMAFDRVQARIPSEISSFLSSSLEYSQTHSGESCSRDAKEEHETEDAIVHKSSRGSRSSSSSSSKRRRERHRLQHRQVHPEDDLQGRAVMARNLNHRLFDVIASSRGPPVVPRREAHGCSVGQATQRARLEESPLYASADIETSGQRNHTSEGGNIMLDESPPRFGFGIRGAPGSSRRAATSAFGFWPFSSLFAECCESQSHHLAADVVELQEVKPFRRDDEDVVGNVGALPALGCTV